MVDASDPMVDANDTKDLKFSFARFADGFDDHISKSIRGYSGLLDDCVGISQYFVEDRSCVVDIGCSSGNLLGKLVKHNREHAPHASFVGLDVEESFSSQWKALEALAVQILVCDVRDYVFPDNCSFVTSIFSLQFIPSRDRLAVMKKVHEALRPGGALFIAEKILIENSKIAEIVRSIYFEFKSQHFSESQILAKEQSLRHQLKPWTETKLLQALEQSGFNPDDISPVWQNHAFKGYLAIKQ